MANTFPPKFGQDILYPAVLNLDELDLSGSPINQYSGVSNGNVPLGKYFNISFGEGQGTDNSTPYLSYGKHGFRIMIIADPTVYGFPRLRGGSRIIFEFKDASGLVLFSDVTPLHSADNLKFMGYVWVKQDPLRTYETPVEGQGWMTISGIADVSEPEWRGRYNFRSTLPIHLDLTNQSTLDNITTITYEKNYSPIIFKNPNKMVSGSGLIVSESIIPEYTDNAGTLHAQQSVINISASNLQTYSGKVNRVHTDLWKSGSGNCINDCWHEWTYRDLDDVGTIFEEGIHSDYATGINPVSAEWGLPLDYIQAPSGQPATKIRFRLRFMNPALTEALNTFPFSGSNQSQNNFTLEYPGEGYWLNLDGTGAVLPGSSLFSNSNTMLLETGAGQFSFAQGSLLTRYGLSYDGTGNPYAPSDEITYPN